MVNRVLSSGIHLAESTNVQSPADAPGSYEAALRQQQKVLSDRDRVRESLKIFVPDENGNVPLSPPAVHDNGPDLGASFEYCQFTGRKLQ